MRNFLPEKIVIERGCGDDVVTKNVLKNLSDIYVRYTDEIDGEYLKQNVLVIKKNGGKFFKRCPCSPGVICCGYYVLQNAENCHLNCTYCFLHEYFKGNTIIVYSNIDKMFDELRRILGNNPEKFFRIGTGEFSDSLAIDNITEISKLIVPFFAEYKNALLELKTKSTYIENLLGLDHKKRTVVSWSVNPNRVICKEESLSPNLDKRLKAARVCAERGYRIGFHFDPVIYYQGWEKDYKKVIEKIFSYINPRDIIWISLGTFRYIPGLKDVVRRKFPLSKIIYGEHILCSDGKMRYIKPLRVEIYKKMLNWIRECSEDVFVYLCMETKEVWKNVFNLTLKRYNELEDLFPKN
ncbi:radical SAM protein [candidate division KSB1 bacterium]